jgi:hypothetical protein
MSRSQAKSSPQPAQPRSPTQPSRNQHPSPARLCIPAQPESTPQPSRNQHPSPARLSPAGINTPAQPVSAQPEPTPQPSRNQHPNSANRSTSATTEDDLNNHPATAPTRPQENPLHPLNPGMWTTHINCVTL